MHRGRACLRSGPEFRVMRRETRRPVEGRGILPEDQGRGVLVIRAVPAWGARGGETGLSILGWGWN